MTFGYGKPVKQDQKSTRCDISKPDVAQPGVAQPDVAQPDNAYQNVM